MKIIKSLRNLQDNLSNKKIGKKQAFEKLEIIVDNFSKDLIDSSDIEKQVYLEDLNSIRELSALFEKRRKKLIEKSENNKSLLALASFSDTVYKEKTDFIIANLLKLDAF
ncbi:hypothetical protein V2647_14660 [Tenacibaculum maritimum]|uniref:hypothetical protein n=1 Tax=Tenacibaculum maritimum TaxID=107401 RepID=UPI0012E56468|nr:hypothetical protein [Tenacibaculum maritimum]CAA0230321.1 hypothetical protein TMP139_50013 [Tenacibaculum maritimum]CAA0249962.1 hypothetical protein TMP445_760082 [Tenacibaculum maritimum]